MFFFCIFFIYVTIFINVVFSKLNFQNEQKALAYLKSDANYVVTKEDIIEGIEKCWFNASEYLITLSIKQETDFSNDIKSTVNAMKQKLDQLIAISYSNKKIDIVNASFQWAQSPDQIFLNIKFSHRWSAPGALKVKDEKLFSSKNQFYFSALSNDSNSITKKYFIDITLLHNIIESETKYNFASVGKVVVTLKKEKKKIWSRLLLSKEKNPSMHVWWDMKDKYYQSVQDFLKEKKNEHAENKKQEDGKGDDKADHISENEILNNKGSEHESNQEKNKTEDKDYSDEDYSDEGNDDDEYSGDKKITIENDNGDKEYDNVEGYRIKESVDIPSNQKKINNKENSQKEDNKKHDEL